MAGPATAEVTGFKSPEVLPEFSRDGFLAEVKTSRPAISEIYGRSLSSIFNIGVQAAKIAVRNVINSPEAEQARVEFYTSVEEGFGTDTELGKNLVVRDFAKRKIIDGKVMSADLSRAVSDMTRAGLVCAEDKYRNESNSGDRRFYPQLVRTKNDDKNALIVDAMARGETEYNTRIVVSPFLEEAAATSGDKYWQNIGYVPHLKRGFVQLYHFNGEELVAGSLSFDGSDKQRLKDLFKKYGVHIPEEEVTDNWLEYPITDTLSEDQAKELAVEIADLAEDPKYKKLRSSNRSANTVDVTSNNRAIMDKIFDESYLHACESLARGYQTPDTQKLILQLAHKAGSFNDHYASALYRMRSNPKHFGDREMVVVHELLVYSAIEIMRALHLSGSDNQDLNAESNVHQNLNIERLRSLNMQEFQHVLSRFGAFGAENNRTYSACGLAISLGFEDSQTNLQEAYGGIDSTHQKQEWYGRFKKSGTCVNCHKDTEVGEKSWCKSCIKGHCG